MLEHGTTVADVVNARVSVIIPAYRVEAWLAQTLDSVLAQSHPPLEVIVVDDGSPDRSGEIARGYGAPVRVITQANAGVSAARNAGMAAARGDYFALLDGDDWWHPHKLALQLQALAATPQAAICYTEFRPWHQEPQGYADPAGLLPAAPGAAVDLALSGWIYHQFLLTNWVLTSSALMHREVWRACGGFRTDLPIAEDWEYWLRASRRFQFCRVSAPLTLYRQQSASLTRVVRERDYASEVIEQAVAQWGEASPSGERVDAAAYRARRFRAHFNHGLAQRTAGHVGAAHAAFARALRYRPGDLKSWLFWLLSWSAGVRPRQAARP